MKNVVNNQSTFSEEEHPEIYELVQDMIVNHYPDLLDARILCAWRYEWKPSKQTGYVCLGKSRVTTPVEKIHTQADVILLLNYEQWNHADFTDRQRKALIDELLASITTVKDKEGEPKVDHDGNVKYKKVRVDFAGYYDVLLRNGLSGPEQHKLASVFDTIRDRGEVADYKDPSQETDDESGAEAGD